MLGVIGYGIFWVALFKNQERRFEEKKLEIETEGQENIKRIQAEREEKILEAQEKIVLAKELCKETINSNCDSILSPEKFRSGH